MIAGVDNANLKALDCQEKTIMQDITQIICPYCGQFNEIYIDYSGGSVQQYVEDCQVCCQPWQIRVEIIDEEEEPIVTVTTTDE